VNEDRLRIWAARLAAPAAFFLAAVILIGLVQRALSADEPASDATPATTSVPTPTGTTSQTTTGQEKPGRRFYRVRSGDTLESIAARFDTSADALIELNPGIDPLALSPGQRIRVRR
jgi:LysM repeat protein